MKINPHVKAWADAWKQENLSPEIHALISDALSDLYTGDNGYSEHWRGFTSACASIKDALDAAPRQLWFDADSGEVFESAPECQCVDLYGDDDPDRACTCLESVYDLDRRDVVRALVGVELAEYIR